MTKQELFAEPENDEQMGLIPQPLTESDYAKYSTEISTAYTSPQAQERVDLTNKQQKSNV